MMLPNKECIASFDVDAQNTFTPVCPNELPVPEGHLIVNELNQQAHFAMYRLGSKDSHSPDAVWVSDEKHPPLSPLQGHKNADLYWPKHAVPGTKGFDLIDGLPKPEDYDYFVWKGVELDLHPYGACYHDFAEKLSTGVIEFLRSKSVRLVLVGGLATDYCVKQTVLQLRKADFDVILNMSAVRGITNETVDAAINEMMDSGVRLIDKASDLKDL